MLTQYDLNKIAVLIKTETRSIMQEEIRKLINEEINPIKKDLKIIKRDIRRLKKDQNIIIKFFDDHYQELGMRVDKLEENAQTQSISY